MEIEQLGVSRYRSLGEVSLRPGRVMVLVGPNNAGKTNLVDAIDFVAEAYRFGLELAVARKGGFENIAHRKQRRTKSPIQFQVQALLSIDDLRRWTLLRRPSSVPDGTLFRVIHNFALSARSQAIRADFRVAWETVRLSTVRADQSSETEILSIERRGSDFHFWVAPGLKGNFWQRLLFPFNDADLRSAMLSGSFLQDYELLVTSRTFNNVLTYFARSFANSRIYQLAPLECSEAWCSPPRSRA